MELRRKIFTNKAVCAGGIVFLLIVLVALIGPVLWTQDPNAQAVTERLSAPSALHPLGTDDFGRDLLARIIVGARVSLGVGLSVAIITSILGLAIGIYACYNTVVDQILMRICDGLMSIPGVMLAIALMAMMGASVWNVIAALTIVYTPSMARIVRSRAIVVKEEPFIEALKVQGASTNRIMWMHIVPNIMAPFLVQATYVFADAVLSEAALSFLGLGIQAPNASWGNILQAGKAVMRKAWWMIAFPALAIIASVLSLNLAADGLRDVLDPHTKEE
ncbi:MAG: ABC transporter permease [Atopobiaceae bacterium]